MKKSRIEQILFIGLGLATITSFVLIFTKYIYIVIEYIHLFIDWCTHSCSTLFHLLSTDRTVQVIAFVLIFLISFLKLLLYVVKQSYHSIKLQNYLRKNSIQVNLEDTQFFLVDDKRVFALTVGFLRPHIYISKKVKEILNPKELKSVLQHEKQHQTSRHPLQLLCLGALKNLLFFLPSTGDIYNKFYLQMELSADTRSIDTTSKKTFLSALVKVCESTTEFNMNKNLSVLHFASDSARLKHYVNQHRIYRYSYIKLGISLLISGFLVYSFISPTTIMSAEELENQSTVSTTAPYYCSNINNILYTAAP